MDLEYMKSLTSIEVGYLHELNRLLIESKEPAAYYDIVENSNFYQNVSGDRVKLNNFYRLNKKLVRPTDLERKLLMQIN